MSRASIVAAGRRAAEAGMVDTCTIIRYTGVDATDPYSGEVVRGTESVYSGKCRFQQSAASSQPTEAGEAYL